MDETEMSTEELLERWENGEPVEVVPSIVALLRSIDASLKVLVERSSPVTITINNPPGDTGTSAVPYTPWVNT